MEGVTAFHQYPQPHLQLEMVLDKRVFDHVVAVDDVDVVDVVVDHHQMGPTHPELLPHDGSGIEDWLLGSKSCKKRRFLFNCFYVRLVDYVILLKILVKLLE